MARIPQVTRASTPSNSHAAFDDFMQSRTGVLPQTGPFFVLLNSPEMCRRVWRVIDYMWHESTLPKKMQELAMIVAARAFDCRYIWNARAPAARCPICLTMKRW